GCVTLGKSLHFSGPQFPRLENGDEDWEPHGGQPDYLVSTPALRTVLEQDDCVFPFTYKNRNVFACLSFGNAGQKWCALTENYDEDKKWKFCEHDYDECTFPFIYRGTKYYTCPQGNNSGKKWCAITPNYDIDRRWKYSEGHGKGHNQSMISTEHLLCSCLVQCVEHSKCLTNLRIISVIIIIVIQSTYQLPRETASLSG
uniref:Fibronectin type-II domain-containing protein n=1 Tax=Ornithorhynchus anatinus TaxID=9258 RepID=A0A6I8NH89_ORNAN